MEKFTRFIRAFAGVGLTICSSFVAFEATAFTADKIRPLTQAELRNSSILTESAHVSDGSAQVINGVPQFAGPMGAAITTQGEYQWVAYYAGKDRSLPFSQQTAQVVAARRKGIDPWEKFVVQGYTLGARFENTNRRIAIAASGDGVIHLTFDNDGDGQINYASTMIGDANPRSSSPSSAGNIFLMYKKNLGVNFPELSSVTAPAFTNLPNGNLIMSFHEDSVNDGKMQLARYDAQQRKWTSLRRFITDAGVYKGLDVDRDLYTDGLRVDSSGKLHISWIWREKSANCSQNAVAENCKHGIYYATSSDEGITWYDSTSNLIADTSQGQTISINNIGNPILVSPNFVISDVAIASAMHTKSGAFHVFSPYKSPDGSVSLYHHVRNGVTGEWTAVSSGLASANTKLVFVENSASDHFLFALLDGANRGVYYSTRGAGYENWNEIGTSGLGLPSGYTAWNAANLNWGQATLVVQENSSGNLGAPSPINVYSLKLADAPYSYSGSSSIIFTSSSNSSSSVHSASCYLSSEGSGSARSMVACSQPRTSSSVRSSSSSTRSNSSSVSSKGISCKMGAISQYSGNRFQVPSVTVTNKTNEPITWSVTVTSTNLLSIADNWRALVNKKSGKQFIFSGESYNKTLAPGASTDFGFKGTYTGQLGTITCK